MFAYDFRDAVKRLSGDTRLVRHEKISKKTGIKKRLSRGFSDGGFTDFMGSRGFSPPFGIVAKILCGEVASPCWIQGGNGHCVAMPRRSLNPIMLDPIPSAAR